MTEALRVECAMKGWNVPGLASTALLVGASSALSAQTDRFICQHTTEPAYSWTLTIGADGKANQFEFTPRDSAMTGANGDYAGTCTEEACTAEKPTVTGVITYRTVLHIDRLAGVAQITQFQDNGDVWAKWQATCQQSMP